MHRKRIGTKYKRECSRNWKTSGYMHITVGMFLLAHCMLSYYRKRGSSIDSVISMILMYILIFQSKLYYTRSKKRQIQVFNVNWNISLLWKICYFVYHRIL